MTGVCFAAQRGGYVCALALLASPGSSIASSIVAPYALAGVEHDSNIFYLPDGTFATLGTGGTGRSDTIEKAILGLNADYLWDRQIADADAEFRRFQYQNFSQLDHDEYLLTGSLKWKTASRLNGALTLRRERNMVPFIESVGTSLYLQTLQSESASINVRMAPEWLLENTATDMRLTSPRFDFPDLSQHEFSLHEAIRYLGISNLRAGLTADFADGQFDHTGQPPVLKYRQTSAQLACNYILSGQPAFDAAVGYSWRDEISGLRVAAASWLIAYNRALTGKTSVKISLSRAINSYVSTATSEIDTAASIGVSWRPTKKITIDASYALTGSNFPNFAMLGSSLVSGVDRRDHYSQILLDVTYSAFRRLSIHPYLRYQKRSSNLDSYQFNANSVGIELRASLR
jgi:hypothetical protein